MNEQMSFQLNSQQFNFKADLKLDVLYKFVFFVAPIFLNEFFDLLFYRALF